MKENTKIFILVLVFDSLVEIQISMKKTGSGSWFWRLMHRACFPRRLARHRCSPGVNMLTIMVIEMADCGMMMTLNGHIEVLNRPQLGGSPNLTQSSILMVLVNLDGLQTVFTILDKTSLPAGSTVTLA